MTSAVATQITSLIIVYSIVYSGADQRKHQTPTSLAFVWEIHWSPVNSPHKWPVPQKMFPFDDVIMQSLQVAYVDWHICNLYIYNTLYILCRSDIDYPRIVRNTGHGFMDITFGQCLWNLFTKRTDVLPQYIVKSRSRAIQVYTFLIALKFDRHRCCRDACRVQSDTLIMTTNLISLLRHFTSFGGKTSYRLVNRDPDCQQEKCKS